MMFEKIVAPLLMVFLAVVSANLVGGPIDSDMSSREAQDALRFAVAKYNAESDGIYTRQVNKVLQVQTQVVSGLNYIFTVQMATTVCKKSEPKKCCAFNSDPAIAQLRECRLVVWSKPWENSMILTENTC